MLKHPPRYFLFFYPHHRLKLPHVLFQSRVQLINVNPIFHSFLNFWPYLLDFNAPILLRAVNFNIIHLLRVLHWDEFGALSCIQSKSKGQELIIVGKNLNHLKLSKNNWKFFLEFFGHWNNFDKSGQISAFCFFSTELFALYCCRQITWCWSHSLK